MIESRSLAFRYPGGSVLRLPDLSVPQGGVLLLRGASGSGKSTLLALLAGLLRPLEGRLEVGGTDLRPLGAAALDAWRAAQVGFVPQRLHLGASLTVAQNLALSYWCAGLAADEARLQALVRRLGLETLLQRRPAALSVGQMQRVALARALARRPRVLLADEPTASLDDAQAAQVVGLLREQAGEDGATLVIATHDARVAAVLAAAGAGMAAAGSGLTIAGAKPEGAISSQPEGPHSGWQEVRL